MDVNHRKLVRRAVERAKAESPADALSAVALAQPCAIAIKGLCLRYNVTLLRDDRYAAMPVPACFRCRCYMDALWENDLDSEEAEYRFRCAALRTWERGLVIGVVEVRG